MSDIQDTTINTYQENFDTYIERTPKVVSNEFKDWIDKFLALVPAGGQVLEVGSAFGRDAQYMRDKGFVVLCTDVVPKALERLSTEGFETAFYDFRNPPNLDWKERFDGYFGNAVLLHASPQTFSFAIQSALDVLKKGGVGAISLKSGIGEEVTSEKMDAPRFFHYYTESELRNALAAHPLNIVSFSTADDGKWFHVVFQKS